jgi:hypothetical protein
LDFGKAMRKEPQNLNTLLLLGQALFDSGKFNEAVTGKTFHHWLVTVFIASLQGVDGKRAAAVYF